AEHLLAGAGVGGVGGSDHEAVAGPVVKQRAVGGRRGAGAVAPDDDGMTDAALAQRAGAVNRAAQPDTFAGGGVGTGPVKARDRREGSAWRIRRHRVARVDGKR